MLHVSFPPTPNLVSLQQGLQVCTQNVEHSHSDVSNRISETQFLTVIQTI